MSLSGMKERAGRFWHSERGQRLVRWVRRLFFAGIFGMLVVQLSDVGWDEITGSLPTSPWFYLIFLVLYFSLPLSESLVYRQIWHYRYWEGLVAFLKKRVLNKDVLGYSGDVYLYLWARQKVSLSEREIRGAVKDNAIVSSAASTLFAVSVLVGLVLTGQVVWAARLAGQELAYVAGAVLVLGLLAMVAVRFRRALFMLSGRMLGVLFAIHWSRLLLTNVLQVVQWSIVIPEADWQTWGTLLAVQIVVSRIPVLPAREWIFLGASVGISQGMDVSSAAVAGMLLVSTVLDKTLNLVFFTLSSLLARSKRPAEEADASVAGPVPAGEPV